MIVAIFTRLMACFDVDAYYCRRGFWRSDRGFFVIIELSRAELCMHSAHFARPYISERRAAWREDGKKQPSTNTASSQIDAAETPWIGQSTAECHALESWQAGSPPPPKRKEDLQYWLK